MVSIKHGGIIRREGQEVVEAAAAEEELLEDPEEEGYEDEVDEEGMNVFMRHRSGASDVEDIDPDSQGTKLCTTACKTILTESWLASSFYHEFAN